MESCVSRIREGARAETHHRSVQHREQQNGNARENDVVGGGTDAIHKGLPAEPVVKLEVEQHEPKNHVLVERVLDQAAQAICGEGALHQQQPHLKQRQSRDSRLAL